MKKIELISFLSISTVLIALSVFMFVLPDMFPKLHSLERAQESYENHVANPTSFSIEEKRKFIRLMVESEQALKNATDSLIEVFRCLALVLLGLSFCIIAVALKVHKRENATACSALKPDE